MQKIIIKKYYIQGCSSCKFTEWAIKSVSELLSDDNCIEFEEYEEPKYESLPAFEIYIDDELKEILYGLPDLEDLKLKCYEYNKCGKGYFRFMTQATQLIELYFLITIQKYSPNDKIVKRLIEIDEVLK